jgi:hypothetical protein
MLTTDGFAAKDADYCWEKTEAPDDSGALRADELIPAGDAS